MSTQHTTATTRRKHFVPAPAVRIQGERGVLHTTSCGFPVVMVLQFRSYTYDYGTGLPVAENWTVVSGETTLDRVGDNVVRQMNAANPILPMGSAA